ncbi:MAG: DUF3575 domain-containing protein [Flavobacteriaceae bacterium]|nr:DUF3575 domain-containing protein [Flavobacteriaceae bacterium]
MKLFLCAVFCLLAGYSFSQVQDNEKTNRLDGVNEVRLDGIKLIAGPILEGSYEYVKNKNSGLGISLLVNLDVDNGYPEDFSITPFYRMYFFNKRDYGANGFFVEGFGKLSTGNDGGDLEETDDGEDFTDFSLGMSLGKKWVNTSGFVFEILVGVSRTLGSNFGYEAYFRGGLFVGYRF